MPDPRSCRLLLRTAAWMLVGSVLFAPTASAQRIRPLFEVFVTHGRPALAPAVAEAYALAGGVRAGGGVGVALGAMIGRVEVAGFFELGTSAVAQRVAPGRPRDFARTAGGLRLELPLPEFGAGFRGLVSSSLFVQTLDSVLVAPNGSGGFRSAAQHTAPAGKFELGVEHRGFGSTTLFLTGGITAAGAGRGQWQDLATRRSGIGVAPIITFGLRTRQW